MSADPRLAGHLNRALAHEMAAVQQYLTQSTLCELWGLAAEAEGFRREAQEELDHARQLLRRMLELGLAPNATQLPPVRPGRSLWEMLELDYGLEARAVQLYDEALRYCARFGDMESCRLFDELRRDEEQHLGELAKGLAALAERGARP